MAFYTFEKTDDSFVLQYAVKYPTDQRENECIAFCVDENEARLVCEALNIKLIRQLAKANN